MNWISIFFWLGIVLLADAAIGSFWLDRLQKQVPLRLKPLIVAEILLALLLIGIWAALR